MTPGAGKPLAVQTFFLAVQLLIYKVQEPGRRLCRINMGTRLKNKSISLGRIQGQSIGEIGPRTYLYIIRQVFLDPPYPHTTYKWTFINTHTLINAVWIWTCYLHWWAPTVSYECINVLKAYVYYMYQTFMYIRAFCPHNISIRKCDDPIFQMTQIRLERTAIICARAYSIKVAGAWLLPSLIRHTRICMSLIVHLGNCDKVCK